MADVAQILRASAADSRAAAELLPVVDDELHKLATTLMPPGS
jgi:hypothetical protein